MTRQRLAGALVLLAALAWIALRQPTPPASDPRLLQREFMVMGTLGSLSVYLDAKTTPAQAETAISQTQRLLDDDGHRWSMLDGELAALNRQLAAGDAIKIPADMQPLFATAARAQRLSGGRFDVRVGALVRLWGFDDLRRLRQQPPPDDAISRALRQLATAPALSTPRYGPAAVQLDFGAIAKGAATDLALAQLKAAGIDNAMINLGGNLRALGRHGERRWQVGIRDPRADAPDNQHGSLLGTLALEDGEAVMTSGDYERYFEYQGRRYHHLLDPASGWPAPGLRSVTVVGRDGAWADAASTALFVAGPAHWREVAAAMDITQALVVDDDGRLHATPALAPRLQLAEGLRLTDPR